MNRQTPAQPISTARRITAKAFSTLEHFLHIQAVSGAVLVLAAATALIWSNSPAAASYEHFWHLPLSFGIGDYVFSQSLHFWINDVLMTVFFLVAGMEIRREIHDGSLSNLKLALLPIAAALGGIIIPATLYISITGSEELHHGWAIPTATDIAFALGLLALLGKSIPAPVRIFLLALAIIDDIVAVLVIALFYSEGIDPSGLLIASFGIALILGLQWIGIGSAYAFILPGAVLWIGLLKTGAHPSLAGVVIGLLTPVHPILKLDSPIQAASKALKACIEHNPSHDAHNLMQPLKQLRYAQREMLPPVVRLQLRLHPWVAYLIMPLFALANAGINLDNVSLDNQNATTVMTGIIIALAIGKPIGVLLFSLPLVRLGLCKLPEGMTWSWMCLIGTLAGVGFTMSIFISNLAFSEPSLLSSAKLGVLIATAFAGTNGILLGLFLIWRNKKARLKKAD